MFRGALADQQVVLAFKMLGQGFVHFVATHPNTFRINDTSKGDNSHLGGSTADVDDHIARSFGNRQAGTNRSSHRLFDQVNLACTGRLSRFLDRTLFDLSDPGGDTNDDAGTNQRFTVMDFTNEVAQHLFGDIKISDDAVFHWANSNNTAGSTTEHILRIGANGQDLPLPD